jgi:PilZ domain
LGGKVAERPEWMGEAMAERRTAARKKSFLQGRIYYNNQRSSVDCLVRDISKQGAKLVFSDAVAIPDLVELYLPGKDEVHRVKLQWRKGDEIGVGFGLTGAANQTEGDAPSAGVFGRVLKLEEECAMLKRKIVELRAQLRKLRNGEID